MPNWAYTQYQVVGENEQLQKLHTIMTEFEEMKKPLHENGFGTTWMGNLVIRLGGDLADVYCRGSWDNLILSEDSLMFTVESAWGELSEVRELIEEKFPGLKLFYQCEESGMSIYETNDNTGNTSPKSSICGSRTAKHSIMKSLKNW